MKGTVLRAGAGVALATTFVLAGCSQTTSGTPAPGGTASGAPSAAPALDAEPYRAKPCDLVPATLPESLGFAAPGTVTDPDKAALLGDACSWNDSSGAKTKTIQVHIQLKITDPNSPGLTAIFNNFQRHLVAYADPTDVSGYQGVFTDMRDERSSGKCDLSVAISGTQVLTSVADGYRNAKDSCDTAKQLAEAMVKTLQGS